LNACCIARIVGGALLAVVDVVVALEIETRWVPELDGEGATRPRLVLGPRAER